MAEAHIQARGQRTMSPTMSRLVPNTRHVPATDEHIYGWVSQNTARRAACLNTEDYPRDSPRPHLFGRTWVKLIHERYGASRSRRLCTSPTAILASSPTLFFNIYAVR